MLKQAHTSPWQIQIFRGASDALPAEVAAAWDRLANANGQSTIFQDREFVELWSSYVAVPSGGRLFVCYAKSADGQVEVVLPMVQILGSARSLWAKRVLAAGEPNFDYQEPLVSSRALFAEYRAAFWESFSNALSRIGIARFTVARISADFSPDNAERDASEKSWKTNLAGFHTWESFISTRPKSLRGDIGRQMRRLATTGAVRFHVYEAHEVEQASLDFEEFKSCYQELWYGEPASGLFNRPGLEAWYRSLIEEYLPTGILHFSRLLCGNQVIAWHFGFLHHGVLHWYKPTYRKQFAHLSPGKLLLAKVIEEGIRRGWKAVDYGPGMEPYKLQWANDSAEMFRWEWNYIGGINRIVNWGRRYLS